MIASEHHKEFPGTPMQCLVELLKEYGLDEIEALTVWVDLQDLVTRRVTMQEMQGQPGILFDDGGGSFMTWRDAEADDDNYV
jgi:hypothetical protein